MRENERSIQQAGGLSGRKLRCEIQPGGCVNGAVEGGILYGQTPAEPDETHEEDRAGQQLLGIGEKRAGVARNLGRQATKRGGYHVGHRDYSQQSAGNFTAWMTRTRQEMLNQKRNNEQKCQDNTAKPPSKGRPEYPQRGFRKNLKKENAGGRQNGARQKKPGAENQ